MGRVDRRTGREERTTGNGGRITGSTGKQPGKAQQIREANRKSTKKADNKCLYVYLTQNNDEIYYYA